MVDVGVGQPDLLKRQAPALGLRLEQFVQIAAGVDDGGLASWRRTRRGSSFAGRR
jgi:hypothetical protein